MASVSPERRQAKALTRYMLDVVESHIQRCVSACKTFPEPAEQDVDEDEVQGEDNEDNLHQLNDVTRKIIQVVENIDYIPKISNDLALRRDNLTGPKLFATMCRTRLEISRLADRIDASAFARRLAESGLRKLKNMRKVYKKSNISLTAEAFLRYIANKEGVSFDLGDIPMPGTLQLNLWGFIDLIEDGCPAGSVDLEAFASMGELVKEDVKSRWAFYDFKEEIEKRGERTAREERLAALQVPEDSALMTPKRKKRHKRDKRTTSAGKHTARLLGSPN